MSIQSLLNPNSVNNKTLNIYSNSINTNEIKADNIIINNLIGTDATFEELTVNNYCNILGNIIPSNITTPEFVLTNDGVGNLYWSNKITDSTDEIVINPPLIITASSDAMAPVFLRMDADSGDPDLRKFGFYYSNSTKNFWIALFNDSGAVINNLMCFEVMAGQPIVIPARGLSLNNNGGLFNIPSNSGTDSFYREYTSSGNVWSGIWASSQALNYRIIRIGKNINISLGSVIAPSTISSFITASVAIPSELRPNTTTYFYHSIQNNGLQEQGLCCIDAFTGIITIYRGDSTLVLYSGAGQSGFLATGLTYQIL